MVRPVEVATVEGTPVEGRHGEPEDQPAAHQYAWLGSEPGPQSRSRTRRPWLVAGLVALVLAASAAWTLTRRSDWPTGCRVGGHPEWCAEPSGAMTDPAMTGLVRDYCPGLAGIPHEDVVPQPLSELDLADDQTFARISGSTDQGSEDALLGRPGNLAWVTRWRDGLVEVRCPGSSATTPSLRLEAGQFRSTVAAADLTDGRQVDFAEVASQSVAEVSADRPSDVSYGFFSCDTGGIDLDAPVVGDTFSCALEVFRVQGQGGYRTSYRIIHDRPYFEPEAG
jgi:hypothetical protein